MARPRSEDKRNAILAAATRVIVAQGLGAPTSLIAQEAGVANGSLFTYFTTKSDLFNQLYLELKQDMASAVLAGLSPRAALRQQFFRTWSNGMNWAIANPGKRRAVELLGVSDELSPQTRAAGHETMAGLAGLMERCRANGPLRDVPIAFFLSIMNGVADATTDLMAQDPANADKHCEVGFDAFWRAVS